MTSFSHVVLLLKLNLPLAGVYKSLEIMDFLVNRLQISLLFCIIWLPHFRNSMGQILPWHNSSPSTPILRMLGQIPTHCFVDICSEPLCCSYTTGVTYH